jgi:hypothetical protein
MTAFGNEDYVEIVIHPTITGSGSDTVQPRRLDRPIHLAQLWGVSRHAAGM